MRLWTPILPFLASALWTCTVAGVYQDEAYRIDYQHALLGAPVSDNTFFFQPSASSKATLLYTLSERNVLGAVNPKDGSLIWRQRLEEASPPDVRSYLKCSRGAGTVVSGAQNTVQAWGAADGRLEWQYEDIGSVRGLVVPNLAGQAQDPVVVTEADGQIRLTKLGSTTGKVIWQVTEKSDVPVAVTASKTEIYLVSLQSAMLKGLKIKVARIDPKTGKATETHVLGSEGEIASAESILHLGHGTSSPVLVWTDKGLKTLRINVLGSSDVKAIKIDGKVPVEGIHVQSPSSDAAADHFVVHYQTRESHWAEVYHVDPKSRSVAKAYDLPLVSGTGAFSIAAVDSNVIITRTTEAESSLYLSTNPAILEKWPLKRTNVSVSEPLSISNAITEVVPRGQSSFAIRSAVITTSGDVELIRNGESEWVRHESLAGVTAAAFAEVPKPERLAEALAAESHSNVLSAYLHRVQRHARDLQHFPEWIRTVPERVASSLFGGGSDFGVSGQDPFGFRKIVVVATGKGRLFGIDAGTGGQIMWSVQAVELTQGSKWNVTDISIDSGVALVLTRDTGYLAVDVSTGTIQRRSDGSDVSEGIERYVSYRGPNESFLLPIAAGGIPGTIPDGQVPNSTVIVTRPKEGGVVGWQIQPGGKPTKAWAFDPPRDQRITTVANRAAHDPIASIGRALGDRSVLYKFLSPNLIVVATVDDASAMAFLYLVDTITGETLYSTSHRGVDTSAEMAITLSENWFAYTLRTDPSLLDGSSAASVPNANLLVVSELFESPISNDRGPLGTAGNYSALSSAPHVPHVATASFVVSAPLSHLATAVSRQGITPRSILAYAAPQGALYAIPVSFLSPRRPVGREATASEREEGLFPYSALLDLNPQWAISHRREVEGVRGIVASPTLMESSILVFAFGDLDVFGTRMAPIGTFDLLGRGFNKASLVLTVVALAIGTRMLAPMAKRKQINAIWGQ